MKAMSLWEFMMVRDGWKRANAQTPEKSGVTVEEFEAAMAMDLEDHTIEFDPDEGRRI